LPSDGYNQYGKAYYNLRSLNGTYLDSADAYYRKAHNEDTTNSVFLNNMGTVYFEKAIPAQRIDYYDSAYKYFRMAYGRDTTVIDYMNNLGAITGTLQKRQEAIYWFGRGYKSDSLSEGAILSCKSIAITYRDLQDTIQMNYWSNKANEIQKYRYDRLQNGGF
jgi:tetratricopeptide (TPR) repeat protein